MSSENSTETPVVAYRIREWELRYEVNGKNGTWQEGQEKRRNPFEYIRMPVHGRALSRVNRKLNALAGERAPAVFGVFTKLMEFASDNTADLRGWIVESDGTPMTADDIADCLQWPVETIEHALNILSHKDLRWIEAGQLRGTPRNSAELPSILPASNDETNNEKKRSEYEPNTKPKRRARATGPSASVSASADSTSQGPPDPGTGADTTKAGNLEETLKALGVAPTLPAKPTPAPQATGAPDEETRNACRKLWCRIGNVTKDPKEWMDWWAQALFVIFEHQPLRNELLDALEYAENCGSEAKRAEKGLGPLDKPGAYITCKVGKVAGTMRVILPPMPGRCKDAA